MCFASILHTKKDKKFVVKALSTVGELLAEAKKKKSQLREPLSETEIIAAFLRLRTACRGNCSKAFFAHRIEQVKTEPALANMIYSEELFIHNSDYADLMKEMMHKHRNMIMENIVIASKNGVIRNDIAPEMIFRMLAGSLRLLIKQYGMSGNAFDLCSESTILFDTWDTLFKIK